MPSESKHRRWDDSASGLSTEQILYSIALQCDVAVARAPDQTLADFADAVIEAIADKILELDAQIDAVQQLDFSDAARGRVL